MKLWECIHCKRKLGKANIIHRCKGVIRKRRNFTRYVGSDFDKQEKNIIDYEAYLRRTK